MAPHTTKDSALRPLLEKIITIAQANQDDPDCAAIAGLVIVDITKAFAALHGIASNARGFKDPTLRDFFKSIANIPLEKNQGNSLKTENNQAGSFVDNIKSFTVAERILKVIVSEIKKASIGTPEILNKIKKKHENAQAKRYKKNWDQMFGSYEAKTPEETKLFDKMKEMIQSPKASPSKEAEKEIIKEIDTVFVEALPDTIETIKRNFQRALVQRFRDASPESYLYDIYEGLLSLQKSDLKLPPKIQKFINIYKENSDAYSINHNAIMEKLRESEGFEEYFETMLPIKDELLHSIIDIARANQDDPDCAAIAKLDTKNVTQALVNAHSIAAKAHGLKDEKLRNFFQFIAKVPLDVIQSPVKTEKDKALLLEFFCKKPKFFGTAERIVDIINQEMKKADKNRIENFDDLKNWIYSDHVRVDFAKMPSTLQKLLKIFDDALYESSTYEIPFEKSIIKQLQASEEFKEYFKPMHVDASASSPTKSIFGFFKNPKGQEASSHLQAKLTAALETIAKYSERYLANPVCREIALNLLKYDEEKRIAYVKISLNPDKYDERKTIADLQEKYLKAIYHLASEGYRMEKDLSQNADPNNNRLLEFFRGINDGFNGGNWDNFISKYQKEARDIDDKSNQEYVYNRLKYFISENFDVNSKQKALSALEANKYFVNFDDFNIKPESASDNKEIKDLFVQVIESFPKSKTDNFVKVIGMIDTFNRKKNELKIPSNASPSSSTQSDSSEETSAQVPMSIPRSVK